MDNDLDLLKEMPYMSPLSSRVEASKEKGFTEEFDIESATQMINNGTQIRYAPEAVDILNYYRFEGMSDPGDNSILYEIQTSDGVKGVLVTPYGPTCPAYMAEFVSRIEQMEKQRNGNSTDTTVAVNSIPQTIYNEDTDKQVV